MCGVAGSLVSIGPVDWLIYLFDFGRELRYGDVMRPIHQFTLGLFCWFQA